MCRNPLRLRGYFSVLVGKGTKFGRRMYEGPVRKGTKIGRQMYEAVAKGTKPIVT